MSFSLTRPTKLREDLNRALNAQRWSEAERLLAEGATVNPDPMDQEALWLTANKAQTGCAPQDRWVGWDWLRSHGAIFTPSVGQALLIESMKKGDLARLDWLLANGARLPEPGTQKAASLVEGAIRRTSVKGVLWLDNQGVDIDPRRKEHEPSSLYEAVATHIGKPIAVDHVTTLGQLGANVRPSGRDRLTPLQKAAEPFRCLCHLNHHSTPVRPIDEPWLTLLVPLWQALERLGDDRQAPAENQRPSAWQRLEETLSLNVGPVPSQLVGVLLAQERQIQAQPLRPERTRPRRLRT